MFNSEEDIGLKKSLIDSFDIVETNFLLSFKGIKPESLLKKAHPNVNTIYYIVVHCCYHMDGIVKSIDGQSLLDSNLLSYVKNDIKVPPLSFSKLINSYLQLSNRFKEMLTNIPANNFPNRETPESQEEIYRWIQRITLHYMGHTGQISTLRRMIENKAHYFMQGVNENSRKKIRTEWEEWWKRNQQSYS